MISSRTFQWSSYTKICFLYGRCNYVLLTYHMLHNKEVFLDWLISLVASDLGPASERHI
jgi:hypothetical protein